MQLEIQIALSYFISFLYNKLPRRRVNIFADELEKALHCKFVSHWYPDKPYKGSAYRCLRTSEPIDPSLEIASRESGLELAEVRDTMPDDLSIWIDPGEVSYRIGERGTVTLLYSESAATERCSPEDREVSASLSPQADQYGFRPIDALHASLAGLSLSTPQPPAAASAGSSPLAAGSPFSTAPPGAGFSGCVVPTAVAFPPPRPPLQPVTFTTAAFAQTKFGSTKLKTAGKRGNRMSPTEFSHYIKQRALLQQPFQQRALSLAAPHLPQDVANLVSASNMAPAMYDAAIPAQRGGLATAAAQQTGALFASLTPENQQLVESLSHAVSPHLQHLLVAN